MHFSPLSSSFSLGTDSVALISKVPESSLEQPQDTFAFGFLPFLRQTLQTSLGALQEASPPLEHVHRILCCPTFPLRTLSLSSVDSLSISDHHHQGRFGGKGICFHLGIKSGQPPGATTHTQVGLTSAVNHNPGLMPEA